MRFLGYTGEQKNERTRDAELVKELFEKGDGSRKPQDRVNYRNANDWFLKKWKDVWMSHVLEPDKLDR